MAVICQPAWTRTSGGTKSPWHCTNLEILLPMTASPAEVLEAWWPTSHLPQVELLTLLLSSLSSSPQHQLLQITLFHDGVTPSPRPSTPAHRVSPPRVHVPWWTGRQVQKRIYVDHSRRARIYSIFTPYCAGVTCHYQVAKGFAVVVTQWSFFYQCKKENILYIHYHLSTSQHGQWGKGGSCPLWTGSKFSSHCE